MTVQTALDLEFADGSYLFDLKLPQLRELQEKCGAGVFAIYGHIMAGAYLLEDGGILALPADGKAFIDEIFEIIRLGLIGGGRGLVSGKEIEVSALTARTLVERYAHPAPLKESWAVARAVLGARVEGYTPPGDTSGKVEPVQAPAPEKPKRAKKSTSARSSPIAP